VQTQIVVTQQKVSLPAFTARKIFHASSDDVLPLIRELGVANVSTGLVGLLSLWAPSFVLPVAISAGFFYGVAGLRHVAERHRSLNGEHRHGERFIHGRSLPVLGWDTLAAPLAGCL
jgi:hypothetical protein